MKYATKAESSRENIQYKSVRMGGGSGTTASLEELNLSLSERPTCVHKSFSEKFVRKSSQDVFKNLTSPTGKRAETRRMRKMNDESNLFGRTVVRMPLRAVTLVRRVAVVFFAISISDLVRDITVPNPGTHPYQARSNL